jgi:hypothetical protein
MSSRILLTREGSRADDIPIVRVKRVSRASAPEFLPGDGPEPKPTSDPGVTPLPKRAEDAPSPIADKVSFSIKDGRIDLSGMRQATKDRLASAIEASLADADFRKLVGMGGEAPEAQVSKEIVKMALDAYAAGEALIYANRLKIEVGKAHDFAKWGEIEGELLSQQGANLANKYIPLAWRQRLDLLFFSAMLFGLSMKKFQKAAAYAHSIHPAEDASKQPENPPEEVAA